MNTELLTVPEVATLLRVRVSTVRSWVLHKRIPYVKCGRILFERVAIEQWIKARVVSAQEVGTK